MKNIKITYKVHEVGNHMHVCCSNFSQVFPDEQGLQHNWIQNLENVFDGRGNWDSHTNGTAVSSDGTIDICARNIFIKFKDLIFDYSYNEKVSMRNKEGLVGVECWINCEKFPTSSADLNRSITGR